MLAKELLDILVCPKCKGDLDYRETENALLCSACALQYRIENNIPVMLLDEAESIAARSSINPGATR